MGAGEGTYSRTYSYVKTREQPDVPAPVPATEFKIISAVVSECDFVTGRIDGCFMSVYKKSASDALFVLCVSSTKYNIVLNWISPCYDSIIQNRFQFFFAGNVLIFS